MKKALIIVIVAAVLGMAGCGPKAAPVANRVLDWAGAVSAEVGPCVVSTRVVACYSPTPATAKLRYQGNHAPFHELKLAPGIRAFWRPTVVTEGKRSVLRFVPITCQEAHDDIPWWPECETEEAPPPGEVFQVDLLPPPPPATEQQ